jgi:hypothetical protein
MAGWPNAVGRGVDELGMTEIICSQLLNLQVQEHPIRSRESREPQRTGLRV